MGKLIIPECHVPNLERVHVIYHQSACYYEIYLLRNEKVTGNPISKGKDDDLNWYVTQCGVF